jgi:hypothetical protein
MISLCSKLNYPNLEATVWTCNYCHCVIVVPLPKPKYIWRVCSSPAFDINDISSLFIPLRASLIDATGEDGLVNPCQERPDGSRRSCVTMTRPTRSLLLTQALKLRCEWLSKVLLTAFSRIRSKHTSLAVPHGSAQSNFFITIVYTVPGKDYLVSASLARNTSCDNPAHWSGVCKLMMLFKLQNIFYGPFP